jgi:hypothetical protein
MISSIQTFVKILNQIFDGKKYNFKNFLIHKPQLHLQVEFSIKDPSFLSLTNTNFSIYFGKVHVRLLHTCPPTMQQKSSIVFKDEMICSVKVLSSSTVEVGIKSNYPGNQTKAIDNGK